MSKRYNRCRVNFSLKITYEDEMRYDSFEKKERIILPTNTKYDKKLSRYDRKSSTTTQKLVHTM